jgi:hypothetical protein
MAQVPDARVAGYLAKNKYVPVRKYPRSSTLLRLRYHREWASSPAYKAPIEFLDMQRKGREREDGTVIVCMLT